MHTYNWRVELLHHTVSFVRNVQTFSQSCHLIFYSYQQTVITYLFLILAHIWHCWFNFFILVSESYVKFWWDNFFNIFMSTVIKSLILFVLLNSVWAVLLSCLKISCSVFWSYSALFQLLWFHPYPHTLPVQLCCPLFTFFFQVQFVLPNILRCVDFHWGVVHLPRTILLNCQRF